MDFSGLDDRDLLVAARTDREAFAELYRRHVAGVLAYFARSLGRSDLAFDLTAETFAAALLALPQYEPTSTPGQSWLYTIAHNRMVDSLRRGEAEARARERLGMQALALSEEGESTINRVIERLDGRAAFELVQDLPHEQRQALTERFVQDRDYAEIAAGMRCSEQVVRKRVSRGLGGLRSRLGGDSGD
ncbi:MAG: RNA polymerase sigma factor [Solirubrobacteraceae bacterium]